MTLNTTIIPPTGVNYPTKESYWKQAKSIATYHLTAASTAFAKEMRAMGLDERDDDPDFDELVKNNLGFVPKPRQPGYSEYKRLAKAAEKACAVASNLAMAYRMGDYGTQMGAAAVQRYLDRKTDKLDQAIAVFEE